MNLLTNFLIRNKIEKTITDIFKTNDLKGPIFDYYLDDNNSFCLWSDLLKEEKYSPPSYKKNTIYYYDHNFVYSIDNFPYFYIPLQLKEGTILLYDKYKISLLNKNFKLSEIYSFSQNYEEEDIEVKHFITNVKQLKSGKILCCKKDLFIFFLFTIFYL